MRRMSTELAVTTLVLSVWIFMAPFPSEAGAETDVQVLRLIPRGLLDWDRVIQPDRTERRNPLHAEAGRYAHHLAVENIEQGRIVDHAPEGAYIDERLAEQRQFLGQAWNREAELGRAGIEVLAAQGVGGIGVARADTADPEAAEIVAADEEPIAQAQDRVVERRHKARRSADRGHDVLENALVVHAVDRGAQVVFRAAQATDRDGVARQPAFGRIEALVTRIPGDAFGDFRRDRRARLRLHDQRGERLHIVDLGLTQGVAHRLTRVLGQRPARAQREAQAAVAVRRDRLTIVGCPEDVETRRHRPVEEVALGEAEVDQRAQAAKRQAKAEVLALAEQIPLADRDIAEDTASGRISGAERDLAGALLHHVDVEISLVGRRAGRRRDVDFLEEAEILQTLLAAPYLGGREGITFGQAELAPYHLVQGARIARDIDALDIDARPLLDVEGHVDGEIVLIAPDIGPHVDEGVAQRSDGIGDGGDGLVDLVGVVPITRAHRQVRLELLDLQALEVRRHLDLAELVALALVDREGDEEAITVGRKLGDRGDHAEIGIAFRKVELAQQLAIEVEAIGIEAIVRRQEVPPFGLGGPDLFPQCAVAEMLVADKADALDAGDIAFVDLEHQIDAALLEPDDLGLDHRIVATAAPVDREDALDIRLH